MFLFLHQAIARLVRSSYLRAVSEVEVEGERAKLNGLSTRATGGTWELSGKVMFGVADAMTARLAILEAVFLHWNYQLGANRSASCSFPLQLPNDARLTICRDQASREGLPMK